MEHLIPPAFGVELSHNLLVHDFARICGGPVAIFLVCWIWGGSVAKPVANFWSGCGLGPSNGTSLAIAK